MAKAKGPTYEELIEYGKKYYNRDGDREHAAMAAW